MSATLERCPNGNIWRPSCKRRSCPYCGPRWARDWQRVLGVNLEAVGGPVATIAITAPGADRLPWACTKAHRHSGKRGCRCQERPLREWCDTLSLRWQWLRQAARLATKRELGFAPPWLLCRVWEPQKRGAPHLHLVVPFGTKAEQAAAWAFLRHLQELGPRYDFGHIGRKGKGPELLPIAGADAARYLASYLTGRRSGKKSSGKKSSIRENIADANLPRSLLWLTPRLTRSTLVTMRTLRRARLLWAAENGYCPPPQWSGIEEAVRIAVVFRAIYPQRAGPAGDVAGALAFARSYTGRRIDAAAPEVFYDGSRWTRDEAYDRELAAFALELTAGNEA